jgi:hypothetical protein
LNNEEFFMIVSLGTEMKIEVAVCWGVTPCSDVVKVKVKLSLYLTKHYALKM